MSPVRPTAVAEKCAFAHRGENLVAGGMSVFVIDGALNPFKSMNSNTDVQILQHGKS